MFVLTPQEREEDWLSAISLYLKGGVPGRAAQVLMSVHGQSWDSALVDSILASLARADLHERAGELYEHLARYGEALASYRRGRSYKRALDLARREFPTEVNTISEEYGDYLVSVKQMDAAINYFMDCGASLKAINAAMECRHFSKAASIIDALVRMGLRDLDEGSKGQGGLDRTT